MRRRPARDGEKALRLIRSHMLAGLAAIDEARAFPAEREEPCEECGEDTCPFEDASACETAVFLEPLRDQLDPQHPPEAQEPAR